MSQLNDKPTNLNNNQTTQFSLPTNMRDMSSKDIGSLPFAGRVGGEMVRRMIKAQEEKMIEQYRNEK